MEPLYKVHCGILNEHIYQDIPTSTEDCVVSTSLLCSIDPMLFKMLLPAFCALFLWASRASAAAVFAHFMVSPFSWWCVSILCEGGADKFPG